MRALIYTNLNISDSGEHYGIDVYGRLSISNFSEDFTTRIAAAGGGGAVTSPAAAAVDAGGVLCDRVRHAHLMSTGRGAVVFRRDPTKAPRQVAGLLLAPLLCTVQCGNRIARRAKLNYGRHGRRRATNPISAVRAEQTCRRPPSVARPGRAPGSELLQRD